MDEANTLRLLCPSCGAEVRSSALSTLEQSILDLIVGGWSDVSILEQLGLSRSTMKRHKETIYNKLGLPLGDRNVNLRVMTVTKWLAQREAQNAPTR